jgi:putative SOS response-associated peptidase YedK
MCGRFDQNDINRLIRDFSWADEIVNRSRAEPSWNVAPTSLRPVMYTRSDDSRLFVADRQMVPERFDKQEPGTAS